MAKAHSINPRRDLLISKLGEAAADAYLAEEARQRAIDEAQAQRESLAAMQARVAATEALSDESRAAFMRAAGRPATKHTLKFRADKLAAVLSRARSEAIDKSDWLSGWAALVALAKSPNRPAPLLGYTEGEGVKYQKDDAAQPVGWLTREAYRKRRSRER